MTNQEIILEYYESLRNLHNHKAMIAAKDSYHHCEQRKKYDKLIRKLKAEIKKENQT